MDAPTGPGDATATVEEVVRAQLAKALGGRRGMLEAGVPTAVFTIAFLTTHELTLSVLVAVACAAVLLVVRIGQRTTTQFVLNSLVGIGIGALFAWRAARGGGDANDQALAYFLPGILYNLGYSVVMVFTILIRWPIVGFLVGSVTGDPTAWHADRATVRLCSRLTWLLVLPCVVRVAVQAPVYLAGKNGWWDEDSAVALLGVAKLAMGWPLQIAALATMVWLLSRNKTPVADSSAG
ncbi:MAG TPA: DUF3159 domain-containing protein [Marmoricola sp.]|nr:DUF3159 domain-containing protein [Marmoricola sp.]